MPPQVCLLTVHGIGFQQPPKGTRDGYADGLHRRLRAELGARLGEDPEPPGDPARPGGGPVYVQSEWQGSRNEGLGRLSRPLIETGDVAHVALVYSPSLPPDPQPGATLEAAARAALSFGHYTSVMGALRMLGRDVWAIVHHPHHDREASSNLLPRTDSRGGSPRPSRRCRRRVARRDPGDAGSAGSMNVLRALEADVAAYVCRNDLRERVRGFVQEAILRLMDSGNVDVLVVNAHSQGSVLCWDVLCRLPLFSWGAQSDRRDLMIRAFVTAGSPIRKYVDLFTWGGQVGQMAALLGTVVRVAELLGSPRSGRRSARSARELAAGPAGERTRARATRHCWSRSIPSSGARQHFAVDDHEVDNVENSAGGGLQAHDYWNNQTEFVQPLAQLLVGS